jgi:hypothetical protein
MKRQSITDYYDPDNLAYEADDILDVVSEPKPKRRPKNSPVPFDCVRCETKLATILRDNLNPKWKGVNLLVRAGTTTDDFPPKILKKLIPKVRLTEQKLGRETLNALLSGDKKFARQLIKAQKEVDALFNRTRVKDLVNRIMPFSDQVDKCKTTVEARKLIKLRLGRELYDEEWDRVQKRFGWDKTLSRARSHSIR